MAYRSPAVLGGADRGEALVRLSHELATKRDELAAAEREARGARAHAESIGDRTDEEVALAEEARRRALLLELGKTGAEHGHLRDALKSERRDRELRLAIARAKNAVSERPPAGSAPRTEAAPLQALPDLEAAQSALTHAREERAKSRVDAEIAARGAENRARELARVVDALEREVERLREVGA